MKKNFLTLALSVFMVASITACGNSETGGGTEKQTTEVGKDTGEKESGEGKELVIWSFFEQGPKKAADDFAAATGTKVDYQVIGWNDYQTKLSAALGSENMPDLVVLENSFVSKFISTGEFINMDEAWAGREAFEAYKANTVAATVDPATIDGNIYGIGWEANVGVLWYRNDVAKEVFGINSVEEMEKQISTVDGFLALPELKAPGYEDVTITEDFSQITNYVTSVGDQYVTDNTFTFTKELKSNIEMCKQMVEDGFFYSNTEVTEGVNAIAEKKVLGRLIPTYAASSVIEYEQPGLWNVAEIPFKYSMGGSWFAVPSNADTDLAYEFLASTFMNEDWLYGQVEFLGGFIGNQVVMDRVMAEGNTEQEYFAGQSLTEKFYSANDKLTSVRPLTIYDSGIKDAIVKATVAYAWDNSVETLDETCEMIETEIKSVYPDLQVVYE